MFCWTWLLHHTVGPNPSCSKLRAYLDTSNFRTNSLTLVSLCWHRIRQLGVSLELPLACCNITLSACLLPEGVRSWIYCISALRVCLYVSVCLPSLSDICYTQWSHLPVDMGADLAFGGPPLAEVLQYLSLPRHISLVIIFLSLSNCPCHCPFNCFVLAPSIYLPV